jgi:hypothetical protein
MTAMEGLLRKQEGLSAGGLPCSRMAFSRSESGAFRSCSPQAFLPTVILPKAVLP